MTESRTTASAYALSDGTYREARDEPEFHRFLREASARSTQSEIDRLRWENFRLREKLDHVSRTGKNGGRCVSAALAPLVEEMPERAAVPRTPTSFEERCAAMRARNLGLRLAASSKSQRTLTRPASAKVERPPLALVPRAAPPLAPAGGFEWTHSRTLALAFNDCSRCRGTGLVLGRKNMRPCDCVLRRVFRLCLMRYDSAGDDEGYLSQVTLGVGRGGRRTGRGLPMMEFRADFELVAKRVLPELEHRLFRLHFIRGLDYTVCAPKLGLNRGNFFHAAYRVEERLGRALSELQPYALFPLDEYFQGAGIGISPAEGCARRMRAA